MGVNTEMPYLIERAAITARRGMDCRSNQKEFHSVHNPVWGKPAIVKSATIVPVR
ncbi:MAG: hypothetical protein MOB07_12840 [Acidobacteria bacterium]|nr:hypothetical protein [Acidobacteriota bacterium]